VLLLTRSNIYTNNRLIDNKRKVQEATDALQKLQKRAKYQETFRKNHSEQIKAGEVIQYEKPGRPLLLFT
jgi:hypothetical protein